MLDQTETRPEETILVTYEVQVQGRRNHMRFTSYSKADAYRRVMLAAGLFARIV